MNPGFEYHLAVSFENSIRAFVKTERQAAVPLHYHQEYEINLVMRSNGIRYIGNKEAHFEEGDLILLAPNIPHCWKSNSSGPYSSLVIQWKEDLIDKLLAGIPEFNNIRKLMSLANQGVLFGKCLVDEIRERHDELINGDPFNKLISFLQLLNDLAKASELSILSDQPLSYCHLAFNDRIQKILLFIQKNYSDKITLSDAASVIHMSEGAFSRFFSQSMHKPFFTFLNEYRINTACKMLRETQLQVSEIGYACGYDCLQFFYRQFTKYAHKSPQEYRKTFGYS